MASNGKRLGFLPGWRIFSYVIIAFNIVMLIWLIAGVNAAQDTDCGTLDSETCKTAKDAGTAIGAGLLIALWAFADVILGVLWLVTKPRRRDCPVCGNGVKKGVLQCRTCGHDFRQQYAQPAPYPYPEGAAYPHQAPYPQQAAYPQQAPYPQQFGPYQFDPAATLPPVTATPVPELAATAPVQAPEVRRPRPRPRPSAD